MPIIPQDFWGDNFQQGGQWPPLRIAYGSNVHDDAMNKVG